MADPPDIAIFSPALVLLVELERDAEGTVEVHLHPGGQGSEGNPGLNPNDTTPEMAITMWIAVLGWILLAVWITTLRVRITILTEKKLAHE